VILLATVFMGISPAFAEDAAPEAVIEISEVTPPEECDENGWTIRYERTTTLPATVAGNPWTRYFVQYVDGDLNLVHYWGSGYSAYIQDYWISAGTQNARVSGSYVVPLWTDSYHAVNVEYVLYGDRVLGEVRAELECEAGAVVEYAITSEAVDTTRDALPEPDLNLVLALDDIPRYRLPYSRSDFLGTIHECQTFFLSDIRQPRASIAVWGRDSITGESMVLFDGVTDVPLVDVAEDYGQPDGQPIVDACTGA
jgi:hypothetical protein